MRKHLDRDARHPLSSRLCWEPALTERRTCGRNSWTADCLSGRISHKCRHVQEAFSRPDPVPTGGTPARATAVAALAADATNDNEIEYDPEDIMGGQGLVEAVFSGMFEDEFDGVMPVRNHKVSVCCGWEAMSSKCAHAQLSRTWETAPRDPRLMDANKQSDAHEECDCSRPICTQQTGHLSLVFPVFDAWYACSTASAGIMHGAEPRVHVQPIDCLLDKWDAAYRNLELAETKLANSKDKKRPTHRVGCCGCRGMHASEHFLVLQLYVAAAGLYEHPLHPDGVHTAAQAPALMHAVLSCIQMLGKQ